MELTRVRNGPFGFQKKYSITKKPIYLLHNINFVSRRLPRTNKKIGKTVTPYHRKLLKKKTKPGYILYPLLHPVKYIQNLVY